MRNTTIILIVLFGVFACGCSSKELTPESAPHAPGRYTMSLTVDALERSFIVHLPTAYDGKTPLPVVVMLHGGGGNAKATNWETGWADKADQAGFIAVFPNAAARNPKRRSSFAFNPQLWNDGSDRFYPDQKVVDDVHFLDRLLQVLSESFAMDSRRVYITGFSNGASMSFLVASKLPHKIAAIAPVAGACWIDPGTLQPPVSMLYITGTEDPLNIIEGGSPRLANGNSDAVRSKPKPPVRESILKWVNALSLSQTPVSSKNENGIAIESYGGGNAQVKYITVDGLGHTWAGGRSILPESIVGATSDKMNTTDVIWDFFQQHSR